MRVYLWEAGGNLGVADDRARAVGAASACISNGETASVEEAWLVVGSVVDKGYIRLGAAWTGYHTSGHVIWTSLREGTLIT